MFSSIVNAIITGMGVIMVAIVGWAFSITNRVTALETENDGLKELMLSKFDEVTRRLDTMDQKMDRRYIETVEK